jgi:S1-C subfamily serine protease
MILLRDIIKEEIQQFDAEQISGLLLTILQEIDRKQLRTSYYEGSLESILSFEISPIWLGKNVKNGVLIGSGHVQVYGGDRAPEKLKELFDDAVDLLREQKLIRQDTSQHSSNFIKLTDNGKRMKIKDNFQLSIQRKPQAIVDKYEESVFLMETSLDGDISCGTCFLINNGLMVTCKHNIEGHNFKIFFDQTTFLDNTNFDVTMHETRDLAVIKFKSTMFRNMLKSKTPLEIGLSSELQSGDSLIAMGYPKVAHRHTRMHVSDGFYSNHTEDYYGMNYVTFTNTVDGGFSGGPVISSLGQVVGVVTESTEQAKGTNGGVTAGGVHFHGTPIEEAKILF